MRFDTSLKRKRSDKAKTRAHEATDLPVGVSGRGAGRVAKTRWLGQGAITTAAEKTPGSTTGAGRGVAPRRRRLLQDQIARARLSPDLPDARSASDRAGNLGRKARQERGVRGGNQAPEQIDRTQRRQRVST